jgi:hypothetical protein
MKLKIALAGVILAGFVLPAAAGAMGTATVCTTTR